MSINLEIRGTPVCVRVWFLLTMTVVGVGLWTSPTTLLAWLVVCFSSILLHEFAHVTALRLFGHSASVELGAFGGRTEGTGPPLTRLRSILVHLAGPAPGLLLGCAAIAFDRYVGVPESLALLKASLHFLVWVNLGWGALNLLPMSPLDGGQALMRLAAGVGHGLLEELVVAFAILLAAVMGLVGMRVAPGLLVFGLIVGTYNARLLKALNERNAPLRRRAALERARQYPYVPPKDRKFNRVAVASLISGLTFCIPAVSSLAALGMGMVALFQLRAGRPERGRGLAIAGVSLGVLNTLAQVLTLLNALLPRP